MRYGRVAALAALLLLAAPACGAELGSLKLWSALGQPLRAEIDLRNTVKGERVSARIAPAATYSRADLAYTATAGAVKIAVRRRPGGGEPYLSITTAGRTNEPVVELLVELTSGGRTTSANYTLFLDPPQYRVPTPARESAVPAPDPKSK